MPPRRNTRQSSASTTTTISEPEPAPRPRRQTRASVASSLQEDSEAEKENESSDQDSLIDEDIGKDSAPPKAQTRVRAPRSVATRSASTAKEVKVDQVVANTNAKGRGSRSKSGVEDADSLPPRRSARLSVTPTPEGPNPANPSAVAGIRKASKKRVVESDDDISESDAPMDVDQEEDQTIRAVSSRRPEHPKLDSLDGDSQLGKAASQSDDEEENVVEKSLRSAASRSMTPLAADTQAAAPVLQPSTGQNLPVDSRPPVAVEKGPKKRLVIRKMALVNFKSYRGRQEIGPFHKVSPAVQLSPCAIMHAN